MPIYEYRCSSCGHQQEFMQKLSDPLLTTCTKCNQPTFSKMLTAAGFQLKGSGWYVTDFKNKAPAAKATSAQGEASGSEKSADGGDKSAGDKSGGDKSGGDKSGGDKSGGDKSGGDKSGGDKAVADKPAERKADPATLSKPAPAAGGSST